MTTDIEDLPPLSIMYDHAMRVYKKMHEQAQLRQSDGPEDMVVWEGQLTRLIKDELHYSAPYYTFITQDLKRMGCIRMLRRGGGTSPSLWELLKEPNVDDFHKAEEMRKPGGRPQDVAAQQIRDLGTRVNALEKTVDALVRGGQT